MTEGFPEWSELLPIGVLLVDGDGLVVAANPAFGRMLDGVDAVGRHVAALGARDRDQRALRGAVGKAVTVENLELGAARRAARLTTAPGGERGTTFMVEDVHELQELRTTFQHQALHDPMTGLPNSAHFRSKLESIVANRRSGRIAVLVLDVDGFKVVSDGLGAEDADEVLRGVADTLRETFSAHDAFVARLFGDGFAVALEGEFGTPYVTALAEQAIADLARPVPVGGIGVGVSASVGIAVADARTTGHAELMRSGEVALHRAKELGKAQWVLFNPETSKSDRDRYRLACGIAGALHAGEIGVAYQPHVVLPDAQIVTSISVSLRWRHPELGELRSEEFSPLAETTGMTVALGRHLLAEALRTGADWRARFGDDAPMVCLTLPRRMAIDGDLVGIVRTELDRHGLEPRHLMLCADGPSLVDARGDLIESISHLARLGVVFIMHVTGMSELELIPALGVPAPGVMLTGPLVAAASTAGDAPAQRHIRHIVERAAELGIAVGARGIGSQEHARALFDLGVVVGAGPYLPEYATAEEAETWVGRVYPMG
ncbi:diguanylate cyclase domain-containing protein [Actinokineospora guangxiensis]|uniref:Diguanylate cyclase domain-containing protein n=1 Tax=Actinokineospora guangxiensis TaxID=1490288 RepID=A0ABW0EXW8_9PSEU